MYRTGKRGEDGTLESTPHKREVDGEGSGMGDIGGTTGGCCVVETEGEYFKENRLIYSIQQWQEGLQRILSSGHSK